MPCSWTSAGRELAVPEVEAGGHTWDAARVARILWRRRVIVAGVALVAVSSAAAMTFSGRRLHRAQAAVLQSRELLGEAERPYSQMGGAPVADVVLLGAQVRPRGSLVLALTLGLLGGMALAFVVDRRDTAIRETVADLASEEREAARASVSRAVGKNLVLGFLVLVAGCLARRSRHAFLYLWVLVESLGSFCLRMYFPQSVEKHVYYVIHGGDVLLVGLCVAWSLDRFAGREAGRPLPWECIVALGGLLLTSILSVANAGDVGYASYCVGGVIRGLVIFVYVAHHAQDRRLLHGITLTLLGALSFQAALAMLQEATAGNPGIAQLAIQGAEPPRVLRGIGRFYRVSGTYTAPNYLSFLFLDFMLPVVAALILVTRQPRWRRGLLAALLAVSLLALVFTLARGGWLALVIAVCGLLAGLRLLHGRAPSVAAVGGLVLPLLAGAFLARGIVFSRLTTPDAGSAAFRLPLMQVAFEMIKAHPWLGVGAGNYVEVMQLYDRTAEAVTSTFFFPVHNLYLHLAAECGVPALLCFASFLFFLSRSALRTLRVGGPDDRLLALGYGCGLVASLFHGLFETVVLGEYSMLWLVGGIVAAQGQAARACAGSTDFASLQGRQRARCFMSSETI